MYFNHSIERAVGLTVPRGVLIATNGTSRTAAHELGHAQRLPDIYVSWPTTSLVVTGLVERARIPGDWGSASTEGYYPPRLPQADLIRRLTMYGYDLPDATDCPSGNIDGLWHPVFTSNPFSLSLCPVGFFSNATNNPVSDEHEENSISCEKKLWTPPPGEDGNLSRIQVREGSGNRPEK